MTRPLATVRDLFRYASKEFERANLAFGQGTASAADEAAFIVLEGLGLPIDDINPWLDLRPAAEHRARLLALIEARVAARRPAAYLLNRAYIQGVPFYVDERVIIPRSYIGELLATGAIDSLVDPGGVSTILDLCTGSGCLAILAARAFPDAHIFAADISGPALEVAQRNLEEHNLMQRVTLGSGDLFAPFGAQAFDLIIANPPYVDDGSLATFAQEFAAEPRIAHAGGGDDGLNLVRRIIDEAPQRLAPTGGLLCEVGHGRPALEAAYPELAFYWLDTEESVGEVLWLPAEALSRDCITGSPRCPRSL